MKDLLLSPTALPLCPPTHRVLERWESSITSWFILFHWRCRNWGMEKLTFSPAHSQRVAKPKPTPGHKYLPPHPDTRLPWESTLLALYSQSASLLCYSPLWSAGESPSSQVELEEKKSHGCCRSTEPQSTPEGPLHFHPCFLPLSKETLWNLKSCPGSFCIPLGA